MPCILPLYWFFLSFVIFLCPTLSCVQCQGLPGQARKARQLRPMYPLGEPRLYLLIAVFVLLQDGSKRVGEIRRHLTSASPGLMERLDKSLDNAIDAGEKTCGIRR